MTLVLFGFRDQGRVELPEGRLSLGWTERIPNDASIVALFLDVPMNQVTVLSNLRIDLSKAIERGASLILCFGPDAARGHSGGLVAWLQAKLRVSFSPGGPWAIDPVAPELTSYFRERLAHALILWQADQPPDLQILGKAENDQGEPLGACSVRFSFQRAELLLVPVNERGAASESVSKFLEILPPREAYPEYLDALSIDEESSIREQIERMESEIDNMRTRLQDARRVKQILFFTESNLEHEVVRFLNEELHIQTRHVGGSNEDFRLFQKDSKEDWCIGEVKGPGRKNVSRADVAALIFHRQEAELAEGFPGLLVVNTFHRQQDLSERDQPVPEDVSRLAAGNNVVIARTLDLVRLRQAKPEARAKFLQSIRGGGGWFEVNGEGRVALYGD